MVTGFFEQFAGGGFCQGFVLEVGFIADKAGGDFNDAFVYGYAELFDEEDFLLVGDGQDSHASVGVWASDVVPMAGAVEA